MLIECIAAHYDIPLNSGFPDTYTLLRRDASGTQIGTMDVHSITSKQLKSGMPFWQPGNRGINLLKLHGSLDTFGMKDNQIFLKLRPLGIGVEGVLASVRSANEELRPADPRMPPFLNEIGYTDGEGVLQFLRRSLIAGAYKFDARHSQVIPEGFLKNFEAGILFVRSLVCIGYGFGDLHINSIIRGWLEFSTHRKLVIVSPTAEMPPFLLHLAPQVETIKLLTTAYLGQFARPLSTEERHFKARRDTEVRWIDDEKRTAALSARTK